jgi:hypothetical protein
MRYEIHESLPVAIKPPLRFRERSRDFEGVVQHPLEVVNRFEPMDVLDGAMELVDQAGTVITLGTTDPNVISDNEYPPGYHGLYYSFDP